MEELQRYDFAGADHDLGCSPDRLPVFGGWFGDLSGVIRDRDDVDVPRISLLRVGTNGQLRPVGALDDRTCRACPRGVPSPVGNIPLPVAVLRPLQGPVCPAVQARPQIGPVVDDRARPKGRLAECINPLFDPAAGDNLNFDDASAGEILYLIAPRPLLGEPKLQQSPR